MSGEIMRADKYFAQKFGSRTKSAEAIEKGLVLVNGKAIKSKFEIKETDVITFLEADETFVSNGGYKLDRGFKTFGYDCRGKILADIGASTGGFTDCALQYGAKRVYAIDVGECLLDQRLKGDERIVCMDNTNARYLSKKEFPDPLDCVVTDVSFISLRLILPVISEILQEDGVAFVLIKPQFECEKKHIGKSGIVSPIAHAEIVKKVLGYAQENQLYPLGVVNAPVRKGKNIEYILYCAKKADNAKKEEEILKTVREAVKKNSFGELE